MVTLKSCNLIGRSRILERVQLDVREVTRPSFSRRLKGVACETIVRPVADGKDVVRCGLSIGLLLALFPQDGRHNGAVTK